MAASEIKWIEFNLVNSGSSMNKREWTQVLKFGKRPHLPEASGRGLHQVEQRWFPKRGNLMFTVREHRRIRR